MNPLSHTLSMRRSGKSDEVGSEHHPLPNTPSFSLSTSRSFGHALAASRKVFTSTDKDKRRLLIEFQNTIERIEVIFTGRDVIVTPSHKFVLDNTNTHKGHVLNNIKEYISRNCERDGVCSRLDETKLKEFNDINTTRLMDFITSELEKFKTKVGTSSADKVKIYNLVDVAIQNAKKLLNDYDHRYFIELIDGLDISGFNEQEVIDQIYRPCTEKLIEINQILMQEYFDPIEMAIEDYYDNKASKEHTPRSSTLLLFRKRSKSKTPSETKGGSRTKRRRMHRSVKPKKSKRVRKSRRVKRIRKW